MAVVPSAYETRSVLAIDENFGLGVSSLNGKCAFVCAFRALQWPKVALSQLLWRSVSDKAELGMDCFSRIKYSADAIDFLRKKKKPDIVDWSEYNYIT